VPVIYTTGVRRDDNWDSGSWSWKNTRTDERPLVKRTERDGNQIVDEIAPEPEDIVVLKQKPSGFFGTNLLSYLVLLGCDSVIVTGTTTSGCVRATVLDAFSNNFRVIVAEEACFDRSQASHAINLCDMQAKYADVVPVEEVRRYLAALPKGLFELPRGEASGAAREASSSSRGAVVRAKEKTDDARIAVGLAALPGRVSGAGDRANGVEGPRAHGGAGHRASRILRRHAEARAHH